MADKKPTQKQINFAKKIAQKLGLEYTEEMQNDIKLTKEFIEKHKDKFFNTKTLSPKQKEIIKNNAPNEIKYLLDNEAENYEKLKEWLDSFFLNRKYSISEKQKKVIENNPEAFSDEVKELIKKEELTSDEFKKVKDELDNFFKK